MKLIKLYKFSNIKFKIRKFKLWTNGAKYI